MTSLEDPVSHLTKLALGDAKMTEMIVLYLKVRFYEFLTPRDFEILTEEFSEDDSLLSAFKYRMNVEIQSWYIQERFKSLFTPNDFSLIDNVNKIGFYIGYKIVLMLLLNCHHLLNVSKQLDELRFKTIRRKIQLAHEINSNDIQDAQSQLKLEKMETRDEGLLETYSQITEPNLKLLSAIMMALDKQFREKT